MSKNQLKSAKTDRPIKNDQRSTKNEQNCIKLTQIDWNRLKWIVIELKSKKIFDTFSKFLKKVAQKCNKIPNFGSFVKFI